MKKILRVMLIACLALTLFLAGCGGKNPDNGGNGGNGGDGNIPMDQPISVLFLGNSLMFFNDMPSLFRDMATAAGRTVYVDSVTRGSATISDFADSTTDVGGPTHLKLLNQWDYVIIEPSRRITPFEDTTYNAELNAALRMQELAAAAGAEIMLYCVWGNNDGTLTEYNAANPIAMTKGEVHYNYARKDHVKFLKEVNENISEALGGVKVIDAGYAFENSIATYPAIELYDTDRRHPNLNGSYLAAATVYATIYGVSPENIGFTGGTPLYFEMQRMAKTTVIDGVVPDLDSPDPEVEYEQIDDVNNYDILFIGSGVSNNYDIHTPLAGMVNDGQQLGLYFEYLADTAGVMNQLRDPSTDFGLRTALRKRKWDAVVLQISRRVTPSANDVIASELAAMYSIKPLIEENTENVYLFTMNGSSKPSIYTVAGGAPVYTDTGENETYTTVEMSAYYDELAIEWADDLGWGVIRQGAAWQANTPTNDYAKGYLRAACFYCSIFGEEVPAESYHGSLTDEYAANLQTTAKIFCLGGEIEPEEEELPDPSTLPDADDQLDVLIIGSDYMGHGDPEIDLADLMEAGNKGTLNIQIVKSSRGVFNQLVKDEGPLDISDFYSQAQTALTSRIWDHVILQITRRLTPDSDIETSEFNALEEFIDKYNPYVKNFYLFSLYGDDGAKTVYTDDGQTIIYVAAEGVAKWNPGKVAMATYYDELGEEWATELGINMIKHATAFNDANGDPADDALEGYFKACVMYCVFFGEEIPVPGEGAKAAMHLVAEEHFLPGGEEPGGEEPGGEEPGGEEPGGEEPGGEEPGGEEPTPGEGDGEDDGEDPTPGEGDGEDDGEDPDLGEDSGEDDGEDPTPGEGDEDEQPAV